MPSTQPPTTLLKNRNFLLLWCAYAVSALGDHLSEMAVLKTQNALGEGVDITSLTARMSFAFFLAFFFIAPAAGLLADRLPRRRIMIVADVLRATIFFFFALLIGWFQEWGTWGPFLPLIPVGLCAGLFSPSRDAMLPTLVRPQQLVRANGMISGLGIIATMAGIGIGGKLADTYPAYVSFRLDAVTFLASAAFLAVLVPPQSKARTDGTPVLRHAVRSFTDGVHYVRTHKRVLELILIAMIVWFCGALVKSVIPAAVRDVYHGTYQTISLYYVILGAGLVVGALIITGLGGALRGEIGVSWGLIGIGVAMAVFALSVLWPWREGVARTVGAIGVFAGGMFGVATMASFNALLQRIVPDRYRGRIFGVKDFATIGALLFATGLLAVPTWQNVDAWVGYILGGVSLTTLTAGVATIVVRLKRGPFGARAAFAYHLSEFIAKGWWRFERVGPATCPHDGPVIIASNHVCPADPCFLGAGMMYRPLAFMIAAEYAKWPVVKWLSKVLGNVPVKRDGRDTTATKQTLRLLRNGGAIAIFIEGRITEPGATPQPKDGVAMLALKTGAPVIPAHISGVVYRESVILGLLARHRARVRYGPPVDLEEFRNGRRDRESVRNATKKIYASICALAPDDDQERTSVERKPANDSELIT